MDFVFDINENDSDDSDDIEIENSEDFESDKEIHKNNTLLEENEKENKDNEQLYFDVFYPRQKIKRKKSNYIDAMGDDNKLKKFLQNLQLNR